MSAKPHPSVEKMWADQAQFNRLFRPRDPQTFADRSAVTREMVLHLISQAMQLLDATDWKSHRHTHIKENRAQVGSQLIDIHKYWITLCQTWGFTPDEMEDLYWQKSMVCRQRYAEEWVRDITREAVILDLDNVLCDYVTGFGAWLMRNTVLTPTQHLTLVDRVSRRQWIDAQTLGIDPTEYHALKHQFRTSGAKTVLPAMPGARDFIHWCKSCGWLVIVLTSRPIDRYPNLYMDTLSWLARNQMAVDHVWWGSDKGEKLIDRAVLPYIRFVVDDDERFAAQYAALGVRTYWLTHEELGAFGLITTETDGLYTAVTLDAIREAENVRRPGASPTR